MPTIAKLVIPLKAAASENSKCLKTVMSKNGSSIFNWRIPNRITNIIPNPINPKISGLVQPLLPASEKPYNRLPKPRVEVVTDQTSIFSFLVGKTSLIKKKAKIITIPAIGAMMLKR